MGLHITAIEKTNITRFDTREASEPSRAIHTSGGFAKAWRRRWSHPVFKDMLEAAVWSWMCDCAQWKRHRFATRFGMVTLERGQILVSQREVSANFCMGRQRVRSLLSKLELEGMIAQDSTHSAAKAGTIVTIVKYNEYQSFSESFDVPVSSDSNAPQPIAGPRLTQCQPTREERNEGKGIEDEKTSHLPLASLLQDALKDWNERATKVGWPRVLKLDPERRNQLTGRLSEHGLAGWRDALDRATGSDYLGGFDPPRWFNFDWLIKNEGNILKLMEGNFDDKFERSSCDEAGGRQSGIFAAREALDRMQGNSRGDH